MHLELQQWGFFVYPLRSYIHDCSSAIVPVRLLNYWMEFSVIIFLSLYSSLFLLYVLLFPINGLRNFQNSTALHILYIQRCLQGSMILCSHSFYLHIVDDIFLNRLAKFVYFINKVTIVFIFFINFFIVYIHLQYFFIS